jgi:hypothetical protein
MPRWVIRYASLDQIVTVFTSIPTVTGIIMMTYPSDSAASDQGYRLWVFSSDAFTMELICVRWLSFSLVYVIASFARQCYSQAGTLTGRTYSQSVRGAEFFLCIAYLRGAGLIAYRFWAVAHSRGAEATHQTKLSVGVVSS